jgi:hypothetical protein
MPAVGAFARGAFPALNFADGLAALECDPFQYIHEAGKAKIGNFAAPQSLHAIQVQILEAHDIVLAAQFMSQLKMMLLVPVGNLRAMLRQGSAGAFVALRPFHFARKFAVQLAGLADRGCEKSLTRNVLRPMSNQPLLPVLELSLDRLVQMLISIIKTEAKSFSPPLLRTLLF